MQHAGALLRWTAGLPSRFLPSSTTLPAMQVDCASGSPLSSPSFQGLHYSPALPAQFPNAAADAYTLAQALEGEAVPGTFRSYGRQLAAHSAVLAHAVVPEVVSITGACDLSSAAQGAGGSFGGRAGAWDRSAPAHELQSPFLREQGRSARPAADTKACWCGCPQPICMTSPSHGLLDRVAVNSTRLTLH